MKERYNFNVSIRTLKCWQKRFNEEKNWDFSNKSRKPNHIYYKVTLKIEKKIISVRKEIGWGAKKIKEFLNLELHPDTIIQVLRRNNLTKKEGNRGKRLKYIRFQRKHANSLWHIDDSEFGKEGKIIAVIDDATRYCLGILHVPTVTTFVVTEFLDSLIDKFGAPKQIITDNGSPYGLKSKYFKFDVWCRRRKMEHIRTRVKRPQTNGKVERLFETIKKEMKYCNNDLELFRYKYNNLRPHESLLNKTPASLFFSFEKNLWW